MGCCVPWRPGKTPCRSARFRSLLGGFPGGLELARGPFLYLALALMADALAKLRQAQPAPGSSPGQGSSGGGKASGKGKSKDSTGKVIKGIISILASHERDLVL